MSRAIWKGSISFGLVNIPVALHPGEERDELDFTLLDKRDFGPIGYRKVNKNTGEPVGADDIARGFKVEDGRFVIVEDEDLKRANAEKTQRIDIVAFVDAAAVAPVFYDRPYFLEPVARSEKGYVLLREALKETGKLGIARVVIRTREHVAALQVWDNALVLVILRYAHEIRNPSALKIPGEDLEEHGGTERELDMAKRLVEEMAEPWKPEAYKDTYREDLLAFIHKKAETGEVAAAPAAAEEPAKRGQPRDMMTLLKRSLETRKRRGKTA